MDRGLFNVVFYRIEECALVNDERREILEELGEGGN
jgi:hypothetical protein